VPTEIPAAASIEDTAAAAAAARTQSHGHLPLLLAGHRLKKPQIHS
jgi:hypothetical protein